MLFISKTNIQIAFFTGWFLIFSNAGLASQNPVSDIHTKIQTQKKKIEILSEKEIDVLDRLNEIDQALNKARTKSQALSKEIVHLQEKIRQLGKDRNALIKKISLTRKYTEKRLIALYKMNMMGRADMTGQPSSVFDFFLHQNSLKQIINADFQILENQGFDLERLDTLEQDLILQSQAKKTLENKLDTQIRHHKKESHKKESLLADIRQKKRLSLAMIKSLTHAEQKLDKTVNSIQKKQNRPSGADSFSNYQGRLMFPAQGEIISKFGPSQIGDYNSFTFRKGIDIKVERGEPIKSVFNGKIVFAQWLKGYGNLLVIDHGKNYYTLYAHVEEILKQKGEAVKTGETIATAGDTGSIKGPYLHFEIRHHGKAVNPIKWLKKGA